MSTRTNLITGIAIGTGMMFLLDPQQGNRRRALIRDRAVRFSKTTGRAFRRAERAVEAGYHRAAAGSRGAVEAIQRMTSSEPDDDHRVEARLRACIGRHSSHPGAIEVTVREGCATLSGPILAEEVREVLSCASAVRGVVAVDNRLEVHVTPGDIPALQGDGHRRSVAGWWEASPAFRVAAGATAGLIAVLAGRRMLG